MCKLVVLACVMLATTCQTQDIVSDMAAKLDHHDPAVARLQQLNNGVNQIQHFENLETQIHPDIDLSTVSFLV
jgi:negative regulator of sigma E activity